MFIRKMEVGKNEPDVENNTEQVESNTEQVEKYQSRAITSI